MFWRAWSVLDSGAMTSSALLSYLALCVSVISLQKQWSGGNECLSECENQGDSISMWHSIKSTRKSIRHTSFNAHTSLAYISVWCWKISQKCSTNKLDTWTVFLNSETCRQSCLQQQCSLRTTSPWPSRRRNVHPSVMWVNVRVRAARAGTCQTTATAV